MSISLTIINLPLGAMKSFRHKEFYSYMNKVKVFAIALSDEEILLAMKE